MLHAHCESFRIFFFVLEQNDSNTVLPLPEERLEDIWLSLPQHSGGVIARCPKHKYDPSFLYKREQHSVVYYHLH